MLNTVIFGIGLNGYNNCQYSLLINWDYSCEVCKKYERYGPSVHVFYAALIALREVIGIYISSID